MRYTEFASILAEAKAPKVVNSPEASPVTKAEVEAVLRKAGYEDLKPNGNLIGVIAQIPDGAKKNEFRSSLLQSVLQVLQKRGVFLCS